MQTKQQAAGPEGAEPGPDVLLAVTLLLSNASVPEMEKLKASVTRSPTQQLLLFYRAVRAQEFLGRQRAIVDKHKAWVKSEFDKLAPKHKVLTKEQIKAFTEKLEEDGKARGQARENAIAEKQAKEQAILASSALFAKGKKRR